ncbi:carbohydrate ABC transporter permease [Anaerosacchariphilus polymeriproducens]|uniref:Sugar ABC transporter permease n=1 Tax=Anaerosacchariphilus polymeriproducens TaxID=1812858 RepID=A0A371AUH4_9FIRM|nr:sugar ABC transporter permease [Anaerosacchariphilus polymeriproducens]RDU23192.1 sugar ABC transporter permease [Anaerosacchariphilus polymeriproducens]
MKKEKVSKAFYLMTIPMAILFFIFHTYPFIKGVFYSFTDWKGYGDWNFVNLRNYLHIFKDKNVISSYLFTFKFALAATIGVNILSMILACALNAKIRCKNFLKAVYFLPYMLGVLIIGYIFKYIFSNIIPMVGSSLGIEALSNNLLGTDSAWIPVLIVTIWQGLAFNTLIYLAGLQTVDTSLYEAASLDGATGLKRFLKITFPLIAPFFTINMVLSGKNYLMAFDQMMAMTNGGPGTATTTISVLIYKKGFTGGQFAYQSANAVLLFLIIIFISVLQLKVLEKREERVGE